MNDTQPHGVNTDAERDVLIFGERIDWQSHDGTTAYFTLDDHRYVLGGPISPATARQLIDGGYMDPAQTQNQSPTVEQLVAFAEWVSVTYLKLEIGLTGYVVSPERSDSRVSLNGFIIEPEGDIIPIELKDTIDRHYSADEEFAGRYVRYWWD